MDQAGTHHTPEDAERLADEWSQQLLQRAFDEGAAGLGLDARDLERLKAAAAGEALLRHPARASTSHDGSADEGFDFATVHGPKPGRFDPKVVQLRLSPFIASACGAVGSVLGPVPVLGWMLVGLSAGIAVRDFWKKKVTFDGLHGQLLYEMYISSDSGRPHRVPIEHLFANVNHSREQARQAPISREAFDLALNLLVSNGILELDSAQGALKWGELAVELR